MAAKKKAQASQIAIGRSLNDIPGQQRERVLWAPQEGPQTEALLRQEFEILLGGAKGGGKSQAGIGWLVSGNPTFIPSRGQTPIDISYVNCADYRALALRKNLIDLSSWIDEARRVWEPMGAVFRQNPDMFEFPSGAKIILGHLDSADSVFKYFGNVVHRVFLDELTFIPDYKTFNMLKSCVRTTIPGIRAQLLLTANPGGPGHCVPYGEVLTPNRGWIEIQNIAIGDAVFTIKPTGEMVESSVDQIHAQMYEGPLNLIEARGLHVCCTPEHKIARTGGTRWNNHQAFTLAALNDFPGQASILRSASWNGKAIGEFEVPYYHTRQVRLEQPKRLSGKLFAALFGWFVSEGYTIERDKMFGIAQSKESGRNQIRELLKECGFDFNETPTGFTVYSPSWWSFFRQFGKVHYKFIPAFIKNATQDELACLFAAMMAGDGSQRSEDYGGQYYTSSRKLADDFCEVALKLGYIVYCTERQRDPVEILGKQMRSRQKCYEISFKKTVSGGTEILTGNHRYSVFTNTKRKSDIKFVDYRGPVYCIGVPETHTFIIRQNGCVWVSGNSWVKARFIRPIDEAGKVIPPMTPMVERSFNPFLRQWTEQTRIYIPARLADNKILLETDPTYYDRLNLMDEQERRAYLHGDWSAFEGEVFTSFRAEHKEGEPDHACHVIKPYKLEPWWPRWIGGDWGYGHASAIFWACQDPNGQVIIYRELVAKEVGSVELGMAIAHASLPDIKGLEKRNIVFYLAPDCWQKRDEPNSIAEMVTVGIQRILGASAGYLMDEDDQSSPTVTTPSIGVRKAYNPRVMGWQYMRELMRWKEVPELLRLDTKLEKLPKLQIFDNCVRLIRAIPTATYDKDGEDVLKTKAAEDDVLDGIRYTLMAHKFMTNKEPFHVFHARRMDIAQERHPEGMDGISEFFVSQKALQDYNKSTVGAPIALPRASSRRFKIFDREKWARDHRLR